MAAMGSDGEVIFIARVEPSWRYAEKIRGAGGAATSGRDIIRDVACCALQRMYRRWPATLVLGRVIILGLVEQEVGGQFFVLVTGKVGLNASFLTEAQPGQL